VVRERDDLAWELNAVGALLSDVGLEQGGLVANVLSLRNEIADVTERMTEEKLLAQEELRIEGLCCGGRCGRSLRRERRRFLS
jgi:hypothetical protein